MRALLLFSMMAFPSKASLPPGEALSPTMHLRKVKMRLMGRDPTYGEYRDFQRQVSQVCGDDDCAHGVLRDHVRRYMKTGAFFGRVLDFVDELLWLRPYTEWDFPSREEKKDFPGDTLTNLVLDIFRQNVSWDHFFVASVFRGGSSQGQLPSYSLSLMQLRTQSEYSYFVDHLEQGQVPPPHPRRHDDWPFVARVADPDLAAGLALTGRFNERFFNTTVNGGRKRAAGLIRLGLCESLIPEADLDAEHEARERHLALGLLSGRLAGGDQEHGEHPECAQCHIDRGLDPLAQSFLATELVLAPSPIPGRFTYQTREGETFDVPVRGLGHWMRILVTRPEYARCQVKHFWGLLVGNPDDLENNPDLMEEVLEAFESRDHRVLDFVEYLVLSDEFRRKYPSSQDRQISPLESRAQEALARCGSCHREGLLEVDPDRILERLALGPHEGGTPTMPPPSAGWELKGRQREDILRWAQGSDAPSQVLGPERLFFRRSHRRIVAFKDLVRFLWGKFAGPNASSPQTCLWPPFRPGREYILMGGFVPERGRALMKEAGEDFALSYLSCAHRFAKAKVGRLTSDPEATLAFLGPALTSWLSPSPGGILLMPRWQHIPPAHRRDSLRHWVRTLVGPESVQRELHFIGIDSKVVGRPADEDQLVETLATLPSLEGHDLPLDEAFATVALALLSVEDMLLH